MAMHNLTKRLLVTPTLLFFWATTSLADDPSGIACDATDRQHLSFLISTINAKEKDVFALPVDQRSAAIDALQPLIDQRQTLIQTITQQCAGACRTDKINVSNFNSEIKKLRQKKMMLMRQNSDTSQVDQEIAADEGYSRAWARQQTLDCAVPGVGIIGLATASYYVVSVFYTPPGNVSSLSYADGSHTGTTASFSDEQDLSAVIQLETSAVKTEWDIGTGTEQGYTLDITKDSENLVNFVATQDDIDHSNDLFVIWLNSLFSFTQAGTGYAATVGTIADQSPDIVTLSAYELQHRESITDPSINVAIAQLKDSDLKSILLNDPFFGGSRSGRLDPSRFSLVNHLQVQGPKKSGGQIPEYGGKISNESAQTFESGKSFDTSFQIVAGGEIDFGFKLGAFAGFKVEAKSEHKSGTVNGTIEEISYLLGSSTVGFDKAYDVYYDNAVKTFAFVPSDTLTLAVSGVVHHRIGLQAITVRFKDGSERTAPVQQDGTYRVLGPTSGIVQVRYGTRTRQVGSSKRVKSRVIDF